MLALQRYILDTKYMYTRTRAGLVLTHRQWMARAGAGGALDGLATTATSFVYRLVGTFTL